MERKATARLPAKPTPPFTKPIGRRTRRRPRFSVALSFPGEHRGFVHDVAGYVAQEFGKARVLYDGYHSAEFARPDLDVYLPALYRTRADLIVVFLCPEYAQKSWCGLEYRHIRQLIGAGECGRVMLASFGNPGDLTGLGILPGDGYLDVSARSAEDVSNEIVKRVHLNRGTPARVHGSAASARASAKSPPPVEIRRVLVKGRRWTEDKPTLVTMNPRAVWEGTTSMRLELGIGFPANRISLGLIDQKHLSIGCTAAQVRLSNQTATFTGSCQSSDDEGVTRARISDVVVEWSVRRAPDGTETRLLTGDRTLWATFAFRDPVVVKATVTPAGRRVFDDEGRPLGVRSSVALLLKLAAGTTLPEGDGCEETMTLTAAKGEGPRDAP